MAQRKAQASVYAAIQPSMADVSRQRLVVHVALKVPCGHAETGQIALSKAVLQ
jgi:hypothetical protein